MDLALQRELFTYDTLIGLLIQARDQIPFMQGLLSMMERYRFDVVGFTIDLKDLAKYAPVSKPNPRAFAYVLLLHYIMVGIADGSLKNNSDAIISLIHDRSEYDSVLLDAFNILAKDESWGKFDPYFIPAGAEDGRAGKREQDAVEQFNATPVVVKQRGQPPPNSDVDGNNSDLQDTQHKHLQQQPERPLLLAQN